MNNPLENFSLNLKNGEAQNPSNIKINLEDTYNILSKRDLSAEEYSLCLEVICRVANNCADLNALNKELLKECIYKSRIFLYENTLQKKYHKDFFQSTTNSITFELQKAFYTLDSNTVLTKEQKDLFDIFQQYRKVVVSAPTSFGKTRMIEEIIKYNDFKNILVVVPTLALSNELYLKFKNIKHQRQYNITKTTKGYKRDSCNILLYTPEKSLMILEDHRDISIDFFVMDEIYSALSRR